CESPNHLDYALLELENDVENRPILGQGRRKHGPALEEALFILQHPEGATLQISSHAVIGTNRSRVRYRATTKPGASGAPCFDMNWNLLAIHHYGAERFNQGIPFVTILRHLQDVGIELPNEPRPPVAPKKRPENMISAPPSTWLMERLQNKPEPPT